MHTVYSLGHSSHPWDYFSTLLDRYRVGCILDVRTRPRSRWLSYSHPTFRIRLNEIGVSYLFMGDRLGGQPAQGPDDYSAIAATEGFSSGIDRVMEIAERCVVGLVCSEHDPIQCHRFLLVSRALAARGIEVQHILRDGTLEGHTAALRRLESTFPPLPLLVSNSPDDWSIDAQEERLKRR